MMLRCMTEQAKAQSWFAVGLALVPKLLRGNESRVIGKRVQCPSCAVQSVPACREILRGK